MQRKLIAGAAVLALLGGSAAVLMMSGPAAEQPAQEQAHAAQKAQAPEAEARRAETEGRTPLEKGRLPGASPDAQTAPSKYSQKNAEADRVPIMARPLPLIDEQRRKIYERVISSGPKQESARINAEPSSVLPSTVVLHDLPPGVADEVPALHGYKYVKVEDRVVIVNPPDRVVVGEITGEPAPQ